MLLTSSVVWCAWPCRQQLTECFGLMDADGSGSIDVDELGAAFKLLGEEVSLAYLDPCVKWLTHSCSPPPSQASA